MRILQNKLRLPGRVAFVLFSTVIGIKLLTASYAAITYVAVEPENGTLSGSASVVSDTTASGGKYVKFGVNPTPTPLGAAFYVSPSGNDSNNGTSTSSPFLTLEKAQSAMESSSSVKTTYLMGGTYHRTQDLSLTNWNDGGQSWLAYPGQTPVLDGGKSALEGIFVVANNITIKGLTIQNFTQSGIYAKYCNSLLFSNNTILNITTPDWRTDILGAGIFVINVWDSSITHNKINNVTAFGLQVNNGGGTTNNSNDIVAYNIVSNTCTVVSDCGAIYFRGLSHTDTGQQINNNLVFNFGPTSSDTRGIYLDDYTSKVSVTNNIIYGTGYWPIQFHGGDHDTIQNNIFDISNAGKLVLYQDAPDSGGSNYGMAGNVLTKNIVYSSAQFPSPLWDYLKQYGGTMALPSDTNNLYYTPTNVYNASSGTIIDSSPHFGDPLFVNLAGHDYRLQSNSPALPIGFINIDTSTIGPVGP